MPKALILFLGGKEGDEERIEETEDDEGKEERIKRGEEEKRRGGRGLEVGKQQRGEKEYGERREERRREKIGIQANQLHWPVKLVHSSFNRNDNT